MMLRREACLRSWGMFWTPGLPDDPDAVSPSVVGALLRRGWVEHGGRGRGGRKSVCLTPAGRVRGAAESTMWSPERQPGLFD